MTAGGPSLVRVLGEWGRLGCIGFGGPPTHIRLLRELCVDRNEWLAADEFEDAIATCNLLPGPASTQLAIFCAWRVRGRLGGLVGGIAFIVPGLIAILGLAALFLNDPPRWVLALGAGAGAGGAVPAVAVHAAAGLAPASWQRSRTEDRGSPLRWVGYAVAGAVSAATIGAWVVVVLIACGCLELAARTGGPTAHPRRSVALPLHGGGTLGGGVTLSVAWVAFKVGALSYGGGFVIIPLMQSDAVNHYHWLSAPQFLNAVALGQITPGPVVQTVAVVGYAAGGVAGGVLASVVAFSPSFAFVLLGARRFDQLRSNLHARAFLSGAGPAAIGAILGSAWPLARALSQPWQSLVTVGAAVMLLLLKRDVVTTLAVAALAGSVVALAGGALPN